MEAMEAIQDRSVECPYCGETVEIALEADLSGDMVVDCEVCCNPWQVRIVGDGEAMIVVVSRLDD